MKYSLMKESIKEWGLFRALYAGIMTYFKPRITVCWVVFIPLPSAKKSRPLPPNREVRFATYKELLTASADPLCDLNPEWLRKAEARGEICSAVFEGEKILSYTWRAFNSTPQARGVQVRFDPRHVYSFYEYTHPHYRRQGLQYATNHHMDSWLVAQGYTDSIGFIETHNYVSLAQLRPGIRRVGLAGYFTLKGRVFTFRSPGAKRYGFRFFPIDQAAPASTSPAEVEEAGLSPSLEN